MERDALLGAAKVMSSMLEHLREEGLKLAMRLAMAETCADKRQMELMEMSAFCPLCHGKGNGPGRCDGRIHAHIRRALGLELGGLEPNREEP